MEHLCASSTVVVGVDAICDIVTEWLTSALRVSGKGGGDDRCVA